MGLGKTYSTKYLVDSNGNTGAANQVLVSTATGVDWVDGSGSGIIGGPYLPLSAGASYPLTGDLYLNNATYIRSTDSNGAVPRMFGINTSNSTYIGPIDAYAGGSIFYGVSANVSAQTFYTGASARMHINSTGNVGIGTTSPGAKLDVNGNTKVSGRLQVGAYTSSDSSIISQSGDIQLRVGSINITNNPYIRLQGNSGTGSVYADVKLDTVNQLLVFNNPGTTGGTIGTNPMVLDSVGNVGIGTTSPLSKLHINDGTNVNLKVGNVGGELQIKTTNDADTAYSPMVLRASEYNILSGNVGINTTSPGAKLDIQPTTADRKVTRIANDVMSTYFYDARADAILAWTCSSYYQAEVVITANQTNFGDYNNIYIRGIWSNNHTSHHWDELERVGFLTGSTFTITVGQNGATTNSGKLSLAFDYISGDFSQLNVRVTDFYGTHAYTIT